MPTDKSKPRSFIEEEIAKKRKRKKKAQEGSSPQCDEIHEDIHSNYKPNVPPTWTGHHVDQYYNVYSGLGMTREEWEIKEWPHACHMNSDHRDNHVDNFNNKQ